MLTINDVARIFDIHPSTVKQWCQLGRIKPDRVDPQKGLLFRREDIIISCLNRAIRKSLNY